MTSNDKPIHVSDFMDEVLRDLKQRAECDCPEASFIGAMVCQTCERRVVSGEVKEVNATHDKGGDKIGA